MKTSKQLNNHQVAKLFGEIAAALEVEGANRFRIRAYDEAAKAIDSSPIEIKDLWEQDKLGEIPGIGKSISGYLDELFRTGRVKHFKEIKSRTPAGMFPLLDISGIGPKSAYTLAKHLRLTDDSTAIEKLKQAAVNGKIVNIEGFGKESQQKILKAIEEFEHRESKMLLPEADYLADKVIGFLKNSPDVVKIEKLGSLRRMAATVGDIDIAVATNRPKEVIDKFVKFPEFSEILAAGLNTARAIHRSGRQVDLKTEPLESFGALLAHFTGSKEHNVALREYALSKGMSLSEHGIKVLKGPTLYPQSRILKTFKTEEDFYKTLGLEWIPPELRENRGEIEAARDGTLPRLIQVKDIKGDFHIHSDFNLEPSHDVGSSSLTRIVETAEALGYEYVAISDHNPSTSRHTQKQILELVKARNEYIDKFISSRGKNMKIRILKSLEIDILPDGRLAVPDEVLNLLDLAMVSVHSHFVDDDFKQTARILSGLDHPKVKIFGHPTARQILKRDGITYLWEKIFDYCVRYKIWLEINGNPQRMDLPDQLVKDAVKAGVKLVLGTDSHDETNMKFMKYAVSVARRGWAEKKHIINTLGYNEFYENCLKRG